MTDVDRQQQEHDELRDREKRLRRLAGQEPPAGLLDRTRETYERAVQEPTAANMAAAAEAQRELNAWTALRTKAEREAGQVSKRARRAQTALQKAKSRARKRRENEQAREAAREAETERERFLMQLRERYKSEHGKGAPSTAALLSWGWEQHAAGRLDALDVPDGFVWEAGEHE